MGTSRVTGDVCARILAAVDELRAAVQDLPMERHFYVETALLTIEAHVRAASLDDEIAHKRVLAGELGAIQAALAKMGLQA